jgi:inner membrane protein
MWPATARTVRFWVFSILLPILPDADVFMFRFGIPYGHWLGHRGLFHSLPFALFLSLLVVLLFFGNERRFSWRWFALVGYFFLLTGSHGLLDALTDGGLGIALLAPFDNTRYFFPWRPILVSPIGLQNFLTDWGACVMLNEMLWIWLPVGVIVLVSRFVSRRSGLPFRN